MNSDVSLRPQRGRKPAALRPLWEAPLRKAPLLATLLCATNMAWSAVPGPNISKMVDPDKTTYHSITADVVWFPNGNVTQVESSCKPTDSSSTPITQRFSFSGDSDGGSITITGLQSLTAYDCEVRAQNADGWNDFATLVSNYSTDAQPASPPQIQEVVYEPDYVVFMLLPPVSLGDYLLYSYKGACRPQGSTDDFNGFRTLFDISPPPAGFWFGEVILPIGLPYECSFQTVTMTEDESAGVVGELSPPIVVTNISGAPQLLPTNPQLVYGNGQATVAWNAADPAPAAYPINGYRASVVGQPALFCDAAGAASTSCTIEGLTNGQSYAIEVHSYNQIGDSAASLIAGNVTPSTVPDAPENVIAQVGDQSAMISWQAPANDGGASIASYRAFLLNEVSKYCEVTAPALSCSITGLMNGQSYEVAVEAVNLNGPSPTANSNGPFTPYGAPLAPANALATFGDGAIDLSWSAAANNGSDIIEYRASAEPGGEACTTPANVTNCTIRGLDNGTLYTVSIAARNAAGIGANVTVSATPKGVPGQFTASAVASNAQATITWTPAPGNGGTISSYLAQAIEDPNKNCTSSGSETSCTIADLDNGSSYSFNVIASNEVGPGPAVTTNTVTPMTTPQAPLEVLAIRGDRQVSVNWSPPANTGGSAITGYTVTAVGEPTAACTSTAPATTCIVSNLTNGQSYSFTVTATNAAGDSPASAPSNSITPATLPEAVSNPQAQPGNRWVVVSWSPADDNGSAIIRYVVSAQEDSNKNCSVEDPVATSCIVEGLDNGTSYSFGIVAINDVGPSTAAITAAVTPQALPSEPLEVSATAGDRTASVSWTVPSDDGGSAITVYTVKAVDEPTAICTATAPATSCEVENLNYGQSYSFTVTATNAVGDSPVSAPSNSVTPMAKPSPVGNPQAVPDNREVTVSWVPAENNGSAIIRYEVTAVQDPSKTCLVTDPAGTSCTVADLTNGTSYSFGIVAINGVGSSLVATTAAVTPQALPSAPLAVNATAGDRTATVSWTVPSDDGGNAITAYTVTAVGVPTATCTATAPSTSCDVQNLSNGQSYSFTVTATNGVGDSPASAATASVTPAGVPLAVGNPQAVKGNTEVVVSWTAADDNGSAITSYEVTAVEDSSKTCTVVDPAGTTCTVSGLNNGSSYSFAIVAINAIGTGAEARTAAVTPGYRPEAPANLSALPGDKALLLSWSAAEDNGHAVIDYTVTATANGSGATHQCSANAPTTRCQLEGLENLNDYAVHVVARNAEGKSPASTPVTATPASWPAMDLALPNGGTAGVQILGSPPGCQLVPGSAEFTDNVPNLPQGAQLPFGVFSFQASGCLDTTLTVQISYPESVDGLQLQKWGPPARDQAARWFHPDTLVVSNNGHDVSYQVTDNGAGDNDLRAGEIDDPFAIMQLAAPVGDITPVPSLGALSTLLLTFLTAGAALLGQRRRPGRQA